MFKSKSDLVRDLFVVFDNSLISSSYHLSLNEQRFLWCAFQKIPKKKEIYPNTPFFITRNDLIEMGISPSQISRELHQIIKNLSKRTVKFLIDGKEVEMAWIKEIARVNKEKDTKINGIKNGNKFIVYVIFNEQILSFLSNLKAKFTIIQSSDVKHFSSFSTYRFYQIFMKYKNMGTGWVKLEIEEIRKLLDLKDKYKLFADLSKRVIEPAINEINEKTSLTVKYELIKMAQKVVAIKFSYQENKTVNLERKNNQNRGNDILQQVDNVEERKMIQSKINEYINSLEKKGKYVSDNYKLNITKKAVCERWGYEDLIKEQKKHKAAKIRKAKKELEQKVEQEKKIKLHQELEELKKRVDDKFNSLSSEEQSYVLKEIPMKFGKGIFKQLFEQAIQEQRPIYLDDRFVRFFGQYFQFCD